MDRITHKKVCDEIKSVICGSDRPVQLGQRVPAPPSASGDKPTAAAQAPSPYHRCHEVTHDYCYLVPVVESVGQEVPVCHVVSEAKCEQVTLTTHRQVCDSHPLDQQEGQGQGEGYGEGENEVPEAKINKYQGHFLYPILG